MGATILLFNLYVLDYSKATDVWRFVPVLAFSVLSSYLQVEMLIHMEAQCLAVWRLARLFLTAAVWVHTPPAVQRSPVFSVSPPTPILRLCCFEWRRPDGGGFWWRCCKWASLAQDTVTGGTPRFVHWSWPEGRDTILNLPTSWPTFALTQHDASVTSLSLWRDESFSITAQIWIMIWNTSFIWRVHSAKCTLIKFGWDVLFFRSNPLCICMYINTYV